MAGSEQDEWQIEDLSALELKDVLPPEIIVKAGQKWTTGYALFFSRYMNDHTNEQYSRALRAFFNYLRTQKIALDDVRASHILQYAKFRTDKTREAHIRNVSIRPHLSAIREFFNACIVSGALTANPAAAVKPPKHRQTTGTTKVIDASEVRQILDGIELTTQASYRDRAMIGTMVYALFRISAVLNLKVGDYYLKDSIRWLRAAEKGGKRQEQPVHAQLRPLIDAHLTQANLWDKPDAWLFPSSHGKSGLLNVRQYSRNAAWDMVRRRAKAAGVYKPLGNHTFRATGITTFMKLGGKLEKAQMLAGHSHISTTKLYDRSEEDDKVEEITRLSF